MNQLQEYIISQALQIALPIVLTFFGGIIISIFNKFVNAKIGSLSSDAKNKELIAFLESAKVDASEQALLDQWIKEGITYSQEVWFKSWADPNMKEKTSEEKLDSAKAYVIKTILKQISDPDKQSKYIGLVENKIHAALPALREQLDNQFKKMQKEVIRKIGGVPAGSRDDINTKEEV